MVLVTQHLEKIFVGIDFRKFLFRVLCGNKFSLFRIYQGFCCINFRGHDLYKDFAEIKFCSCLKKQCCPRPYFVVWEINTFLLERNNQWSREDVAQKTLYQTETLIFVHQFLKNLAWINFRDLTVSGVEKRIRFCNFGQIPRNSPNFLHAKMSSLKVLFSAS